MEQNNTITTQTLSPAQFIAARAFARAYDHLWSSVPDGTYDIAKIKEMFQDEEIGIKAPSVKEDPVLGLQVIHTTGSGRLNWQIDEYGSIMIEVHRPGPDGSLLVAHVTVLNGDTNKMDIGLRESFSVGEITLASSDPKRALNRNGQCKPGWSYAREVRDNLLFERHVKALIRPLVALFMANEQRPQASLIKMELRELNKEEHQTTFERDDHDQDNTDPWYLNVIAPAIERAKAILAPLFEVALPDPENENPLDNDSNPAPLPPTYWLYEKAWSHPHYNDVATYVIVHQGERFPVESEKTAIHTVLLLRKQPEVSLIDAVRAAIVSSSYRPA